MDNTLGLNSNIALSSVAKALLKGTTACGCRVVGASGCGGGPTLLLFGGVPARSERFLYIEEPLAEALSAVECIPFEGVTRDVALVSDLTEEGKITLRLLPGTDQEQGVFLRIEELAPFPGEDSLVGNFVGQVWALEEGGKLDIEVTATEAGYRLLARIPGNCVAYGILADSDSGLSPVELRIDGPRSCLIRGKPLVGYAFWRRDMPMFTVAVPLAGGGILYVGQPQREIITSL